jgi:glutamyl-tRNA synthetase
LFARHHGGEFLLRIEDTDRARTREEWVTGVEETLRWLGTSWDGGVVRQSQRFSEYRAAADQLLDEGAAYECFCTPEDITARNEAARAAGRSPGYDGHCRDLTESERVAMAAEGRPRTLRFRTPDEGTSMFLDLIRGEVRVDWATVSDFVIVRADGTPLFFLANAVDDLGMGITHVIRGEDLLDSTHRILALRAALDPRPPPTYAHLPLIVGPDRAKLSKRHGAVALEELRQAGYLPEALRNYLALLGWAPRDGREVLDTEELIGAFELDDVTHAAAAFDHEKLDWLNGEWIRRLPMRELEAAVLPLARDRYGEDVDLGRLRAALELGQERSSTLGRLLEQANFLFVDDADFEIEPSSWDRLATTDRVDEVLAAVERHLEQLDDGDDVDLLPLLDALGVNRRKTMPAVYAAIEGRQAGLPLFDSIRVLGRDVAIARVRRARERLQR